MKKIRSVLSTMTMLDFSKAAALDARKARVNEIQARLEQDDADRQKRAEAKRAEEQRWCAEMGHPEYQSAENLKRMLKKVNRSRIKQERGDFIAEQRRKMMRGDHSPVAVETEA